MARYLRVSMFFDDGITGWSESHYDTVSQTLTDAIVKARTILVPARRGLLASGPFLKYLRASYDDTWRDSQVFFLPAPVKGINGQYVNNTGWAGLSAATEWTTALLRGIGGDLYRKQIYISGIPYPDPTDISSPFDDPILVAAFQAYKNVLVTNNYGFPVWQRDIITYPYKTITAIALAGPPAFGTLLTVPNHGFTGQPGTRAWVWNTKFLVLLTPPNFKNPNGAYAYTVVDPNTLNLPAFPYSTQTPFVSGQIQMQVKGVIPYTDIALERFTQRKRGRPFDAPRGRSRRKTKSGAAVK